jgi:hypothetical protein
MHGTNLEEIAISKIYKLSQIYKLSVTGEEPPLWSSGQSSWLQIRRPGFDSRHYQKRKM